MKEQDDWLFDWSNLVVFGNVLIQIAALFFAPAMALAFSLLALDIGVSEATAEDGTPIVRAGSFIVFIGVTYVFIEEFWSSGPKDVGNEILHDPLITMLRERAKSKYALVRLSNIITWTQRMHRPTVIATEYTLVAGGTLLNGFGDLLRHIIT